MLASALAVAGCGPERGLSIREPADRAFVRGGAPMAVSVVAHPEGVAEIVVALDGREVARLARGADGFFSGEIPAPAAGRHRLEAWAPGLPAAPASSDVFVDRLPDSPVEGEGFAPDGRWAVALSGARPADDGLYAGRLVLAPLDGGPTRVLTEDGVSAEVSAPQDGSSARHVAWLDGWADREGTLHLDRVVEVEGAPPPRVWDGVAAFRFDASGETFALRDEGVRVMDIGGGLDGAEHAVVSESDAFVFVGSAVVSFDETDVEGSYAVAFASPPDFATVLAAPRVEPLYGASPSGAEVALRTFAEEGLGDLLLYDFETHAMEEPVDRASAFSFSPDGAWLVAIARTQTNGAGNLAVSRRLPTALPFEVVVGTFVAAAYRGDGQALIALADDGALVEVELATAMPEASAIAAGVTRFATLAGTAVLWADGAGDLFLRGPGGVVTPVGALHPQRPEMVIARDGTAFAFPRIASATREPVRRVDVASGIGVDHGQRAHGPVLLAGGALAWRETRGDAEEGGLANDDLWLSPAFPGSLFGERRAAERAGPVAVSQDGEALAVLEGMPRRGESFAAHVRCLAADFRTDVRGPADSARRGLRFLPDGRLVRFGADREETGVMFVEPCPR